MKSKPVFALPEVQDDLEVARTHYASWRSDGSEHFLDKYEETRGKLPTAKQIAAAMRSFLPEN